MLFFNANESAPDIPAVTACLGFLNSLHGKTPESGVRLEISDGISVSFSAYAPADASERKWEAHRAFADLHVVLSGLEKMRIGYVPEMSAGEYDGAKDFLPLRGGAKTEITLAPGYPVLLLPNDAHMVGIATEKGGEVIKAVFKIRADLAEKK